MEIVEQGNSATLVLLDEVTLTNSFNDNVSEAFRMSPLLQLELGFVYTPGSGETSNKATIKVLHSADGANFEEYSIASDGTPSGGVVESTLYRRRFVIIGDGTAAEDRWYPLPTGAKHVKLAAMESGVASNPGTLTIKARITNVTNL